MTSMFDLVDFSRGPYFVISNSITSGFVVEGCSPTQRNSPLTESVMLLYSRLARMHGGSASASVMGLLLATMFAPERAWPRALRASGLSFAFSPSSVQLSYERLCHEQWCGA